MENRFGIKDFFLFLILLLVIGVIVLAMVQYDRQWDLLREINTRMTQETTDLSAIRRLLEQGGGPSSRPTTQSSAMVGFERVLKSHAAPDFALGDAVVNAFLSQPHKLTPLISQDLAGSEVLACVLDSLADRDPNTLEWIPRLATSWSVKDNTAAWQVYFDQRKSVPLTEDEVVKESDCPPPEKADERKSYIAQRKQEGRRPEDVGAEPNCPSATDITFQLRRGVTFSDGSPFSADDVVFTFAFIRDERIECPRDRAYMTNLRTVEKLDDYTVRFTYKSPYFKSFEVAAGWSILPKAFYSKFDPTDFNRSTGLLLGSGPYRMPDPTAWRPEPGKPVILVRNERYWGPTPSFNRLVWNTISEASARTTAFKNGDIDAYGGSTSGITPEQYDQMVADPELSKRADHWMIDTPTQGDIFIGWNEKVGAMGPPSVFADVRVRKAMTMLTDRDGIVRDIMRGYATVMSSPFSPLTPQTDPSIKPWPYDPAAAEKLLNGAGFKRDGDRLVGPDGKPFEFKLMFNTSNETRRRIASLIRDSYARAGILVNLDPAEFSVCIKRMDDRQFEAYLGGWGGVIESDPYQIFHSSQIAGTGDNFCQFRDEAVDKAIEAARAEVVDEKRWPLWHDVHRALHEAEPYTFLYEDKDMEFLSNRFHGVEATKLGLNAVWEWYTPANLQKYRD
jgi:peptide/nickel transport system substrate-binding protein